MKFSSILFFLLLSIYVVGQSGSIIISPIGQQTVYEESRITVYFATLKHFESIDFTTTDLPEFATLSYDQTGDGFIAFDPDIGDEGMYSIDLHAASGDLSNTISFNVEVLPLDKVENTVFYIDPVNGNDDAVGTEEDPFKTLSNFLETKNFLIDDNTYIFLKSGYHGSPVFSGTRSNPVRVLSAAGHTPRVKKLSFSFTTNWYISGLDISPQNDNKTDIETLINVFAGSKFIEITNCKIYAIDDASVWTNNEMWYEGSGNGILSSGTECLFRNNYLKNTWFSVEMRKSYNEFSYNIINWFGADAVRAIASNQTVSYNQIKNAVVYDYDHPTRPQHDDAIQSWTFNNPVKNIKLIGNQIADIADPNLPLPTEIMQGIADFDGYAEDWEVVNNLVITHHAHGIALYGAKNCNVSNNTVTRNPFNYYFQNFKPWIRINPRKVTVGNDPSFGNLVRNNIMSSYEDENLEPATIDHNIITTNYNSIYKDYANWDFTLADNSPAIDAGKDESTPLIDQSKKLRNDAFPDAGCYEKGATLTDRTPPTTPGNLQFVAGHTNIDFTWLSSTDNTGVYQYKIELDGSIIHYSNTNSIDIPRLEAGQEYDVLVTAIDSFGNESEAAYTTATTIEEDMTMIHYVSAYRHDQLIKSNLKLMWVGMPYLNIGDYNGNEDAVAVLPFQLPCIDNARKIISADILTNIYEIQGTPSGNIDAYLIEMRAKSDVLTTDFYQGDSSLATSGILIAPSYLDISANETVGLNEEQQVNFGTIIDNLYDSGACNKFAFIRLNSSIENEASNNYYSIFSSDSEISDKRPLLKIISTSTVSTKSVEIENGLRVKQNPILNDEILFIKSDQFTGETKVLSIHNAQGKMVFSRIIPKDETEIIVNLDLSKGIYFTTLLGKSEYAQVKFIKL